MAVGLFAILLGFGLGISLAAPPGPVNALIARQASRHGAAGGIRAGIPAPIVDTIYMVLVLFGLPRLVDIARFERVLAAVGAALMLVLAWDTTRHRATGKQLAGPLAVWTVTLSNPFQYAWWITAGTAFLGEQGAWGIAGFVVAIFGWVFGFSLLVARGAQRWDWFAPLVAIVAADLLLTFALVLAARSF